MHLSPVLLLVSVHEILFIVTSDQIIAPTPKPHSLSVTLTKFRSHFPLAVPLKGKSVDANIEITLATGTAVEETFN